MVIQPWNIPQLAAWGSLALTSEIKDSIQDKLSDQNDDLSEARGSNIPRFQGCLSGLGCP